MLVNTSSSCYEELKRVEIILRVLSTYRCDRDETGICHYVNRELTNLDLSMHPVIQAVRHSFSQWPKFSGDIHYPIPHCDGIDTPFDNGYAKWRNNSYGDDRRELALFVANYLRDNYI